MFVGISTTLGIGRMEQLEEAPASDLDAALARTVRLFIAEVAKAEDVSTGTVA